jgi:hypothetical protein
MNERFPVLISLMSGHFLYKSHIAREKIIGPCACSSELHKLLKRSYKVGTYKIMSPSRIGHNSGISALKLRRICENQP